MVLTKNYRKWTAFCYFIYKTKNINAIENNTNIQQANKLVFLVLILFILGLLIGLFVQNMTNPRMALAAHLEGIMNGMFLIILGFIWNRLILSKTVFKVTFEVTAYGTFANLAAVIIAALTGL